MSDLQKLRGDRRELFQERETLIDALREIRSLADSPVEPENVGKRLARIVSLAHNAIVLVPRR
jgi:hypothetical protein